MNKVPAQHIVELVTFSYYKFKVKQWSAPLL